MTFNKRAAIELSMGTIVIIVLGVTMLILGMVLVRSIMCSAVGMTGEINDKVKGELDKYFEQSQEEVVCLGQSGEVSFTPGETNFVWCVFNVPEAATFSVKAVSVAPLGSSGLKEATLQRWMSKKETSNIKVKPGEKKNIAPVTFTIPEDAAEGSGELMLEVTKTLEGETQADSPSSVQVFFKVSRVGFVKATMC